MKVYTVMVNNFIDIIKTSNHLHFAEPEKNKNKKKQKKQKKTKKKGKKDHHHI